MYAFELPLQGSLILENKSFLEKSESLLFNKANLLKCGKLVKQTASTSRVENLEWKINFVQIVEYNSNDPLEAFLIIFNSVHNNGQKTTGSKLDERLNVLLTRINKSKWKKQRYIE